jgi:hypothetical protein
MRCLVIFFLVLLSINFTSAQTDEPGVVQKSMKEKHSGFEDVAGLKNSVLWASTWWEVDFNDAHFVICLQEPPSYGQSNYEVDVWRRGGAEKFDLVWMFCSKGIGPVNVKVDDKSGILQIYSGIKNQDQILGVYSFSAVRD